MAQLWRPCGRINSRTSQTRPVEIEKHDPISHEHMFHYMMSWKDSIAGYITFPDAATAGSCRARRPIFSWRAGYP